MRWTAWHPRFIGCGVELGMKCGASVGEIAAYGAACRECRIINGDRLCKADAGEEGGMGREQGLTSRLHGGEKEISWENGWLGGYKGNGIEMTSDGA